MNLTKRNLLSALAALSVFFLFSPGAVEAKNLYTDTVDFDTVGFSDSTNIDNAYWPLTGDMLFPDKTLVYIIPAEEEEGEECTINYINTTGGTKIVDGVEAVVVRDQEWLDYDCDGSLDFLEEDTFDWYAQDDLGNIWYLGEDTESFCDAANDECEEGPGPFDDGSWEAGKDIAGVGSDAEAGIVMLAHPIDKTLSGVSYRQEYYEDEAEDMGKILRLNVPMMMMGGDDNNGGALSCLKTKEWTPLERGEVEHKFYCPGSYGLVKIEELKGKTVIVILSAILDANLGDSGPEAP